MDLLDIKEILDETFSSIKEVNEEKYNIKHLTIELDDELLLIKFNVEVGETVESFIFAPAFDNSIDKEANYLLEFKSKRPYQKKIIVFSENQRISNDSNFEIGICKIVSPFDENWKNNVKEIGINNFSYSYEIKDFNIELDQKSIKKMLQEKNINSFTYNYTGSIFDFNLYSKDKEYKLEEILMKDKKKMFARKEIEWEFKHSFRNTEIDSEIGPIPIKSATYKLALSKDSSPLILNKNMLICYSLILTIFKELKLIN